MVWGANREQFYELLLINCNAPLDNTSKHSFQDYFYNVSVHKIEEKIPNGSPRDSHELNLMNATILMTGEEAEMDVPLFLPVRQQEEMGEVLRQIEAEEVDMPREVYNSRMRVQNCSLLLPETVFVDRLSQRS